MNKYYSSKANTAATKKIFKYAAQAEKEADISSKLKEADKANKGSVMTAKKEDTNISTSREEIMLAKRLQEAVIWTEILGKPLSKRRKRR